MKEKDRKKLLLIEKNKEIEILQSKLSPPKKDIETLLRFHKSCRAPSTDELFEDILGERNLLISLERYGENSNYRKASTFEYSKDSNAKSKRPSAAWLHSKVERYEHEAIN